MGTFNFPPPRRADGTPVEPGEQLATPEPQPVSFDYLGYRGLTAFCDPTKADTAAILDYRARIASITRTRAKDEQDDADDVLEIAERIEGRTSQEARDLVGAEEYRRVMRFYRDSQLQEVENAPELFPLRARIVAPCIIAWNAPGEGEAPSEDAFLRNGALANAIVPAIWSWFRPFMMPSAEPEESAEEKTATTEKTKTNRKTTSSA